MILTCPSCSASYNVPKEAIGSEGRTVRCKKCRHEWFQDGEKQALEDLINHIQAHPDDLNDIDFDDGKKKPKLAAPPKDSVPLREKVAGLTQKIFPPELKTYLFSKGNRGYLDHFASFMVALAAFMCFFWFLVEERWTITRYVPSLTSVYEAGGFPLYNYARINPEEALIIDRVTLETDEDKRNLIGSLINLSSSNIKVPKLKLLFLDETGKPLKEMLQALPISVIAKEKTYQFNISLPDSAPKLFGSIKMSFTETLKH